MPVETELRENGQVIYFKISDPWTLDDLFKGFAQSTAQRDSVRAQDPTRRVHSLVDLTLTKQAPPNVLKGRKLPGLTHPTRGEIVFAVKDAFPRSIGETMLKLMHADGHFFDTLDEAWGYLRTILQNPAVEAETDSGSRDK